MVLRQSCKNRNILNVNIIYIKILSYLIEVIDYKNKKK